ncbi:chorismate transformation enzyme, FkbO/Hyg5 family [Horticoccus sp. 23ND18S-11]|uniref:chorismate transformation enzyme, FkbO/Hyg5 family n=1 Tax=Horticoccus sp. 23ND18S-11 TaxID=3391832 RepID=UPI0039C94EE7
MLVSPVTPRPAEPAFRIAFDGSPALAEPATLQIRTPWLAGAPVEALFPHVATLPAAGGVQLFQAGEFLLGYAREPLTHDDVAVHAEALYRRLLTACGRHHLYRAWNYVPQINAQPGAVENYRAFCLGRARAFEKVLGPGFETRLPAASAVGCEGRQLDVIFVAGENAPHHFENPEQVPAYHYPIEHGPRSPSFARATVARDGANSVVFVSGTAAIKGHQTVAPGVLDGQLDCTLDNLRLISRAVGLGDRFTSDRITRRQFKIYLRHPEDLGRARTRLERDLLQPTDTVTYLHAEICRAALDVEIEATLFQTG